MPMHVKSLSAACGTDSGVCNTRILSVLRAAANKVDGLRGLSDADLLDRWFDEFSRLRTEMQRASWEPGRRQG